MSTIPDLPRSNHSGECPWCKEYICDGIYEDETPHEVNELDDSRDAACPHCGKPIMLAVDEEVTTTYHVTIKARRSATDERYIAALAGAKVEGEEHEDDITARQG